MAAPRSFKLQAPYQAAGDQPEAIDQLVRGIEAGDRFQTLLGVTGSGKTFTMASAIARLDRPALIFAPNKTLAAQLFTEFKQFFPENAVEYFVSYYDYYQPEAYVPERDLFIDKDAKINEELEKLRLSATRSLLERRDTIVVASVSCVYGLGDPSSYLNLSVQLKVGDTRDRAMLLRDLVAIQYSRNQVAFEPGVFRVRGDVVEVYPAYEDVAYRIELWGDEIERLSRIDPLRGVVLEKLDGAHHLAQEPLRHPRGPAQGGHPRDQGRTGGPGGGTARPGPHRRAAAPAPAHHLRHRDDEGDGLLLGHRELLPVPGRAQPGRAAPHPAGLLPRGLHPVHGRKPRGHRASCAACTWATARASRPWWTTASGCRPPWTTGPCSSRSSRRG